MKKIALIGDYNPGNELHRRTEKSIEHSNLLLGSTVGFGWVNTTEIPGKSNSLKTDYDGYWIAPGSPYRNMEAVLQVIEFARKNNIPTLGTCGGFQHMVIEFARNVLHVKEASHAEYNPYASRLVVNPLSCNLKGEPMEVQIIRKSSKVYNAYDSEEVKENYHCNFGLNPDYQNELDEAGFRIVASDSRNEARIMELEDHPFFVATLFVPQDSSSVTHPHPIVTAFIEHILTYSLLTSA